MALYNLFFCVECDFVWICLVIDLIQLANRYAVACITSCMAKCIHTEAYGQKKYCHHLFADGKVQYI